MSRLTTRSSLVQGNPRRPRCGCGSWFASTRHIYEANYTNDVIPDDAGKFNVSSGSSRDVSDLERLIAAASGDPAGPRDSAR